MFPLRLSTEAAGGKTGGPNRFAVIGNSTANPTASATFGVLTQLAECPNGIFRLPESDSLHRLRAGTVEHTLRRLFVKRWRRRGLFIAGNAFSEKGLDAFCEFLQDGAHFHVIGMQEI